MPDNPQYADNFINDILTAWKELAEDAVFGEMTLAQFRTAVKPSLDSRADIKSHEFQLTEQRQKRKLADPESVETCLKVVNGVRSSSKFGPTSALYKAMGYVPDNERSSGLTRRRAKKPELVKEPASETPPESEKKIA